MLMLTGFTATVLGILPFLILAYLLANGALSFRSAARVLALHTPPVAVHRPSPSQHAPPTVRRPRHHRPAAASKPRTPR